MAQALITINGVAGSNDDLPINQVVNLSNQNNGGETTFFWEILDQPPGVADLLNFSNIQSPSFTPRKEGSYLIQLTVNNNTDLSNRVVAAVRFLKTRERAPAAQEQTEVSSVKGWSEATNRLFSRLNDVASDPGIIIGVAGEGMSTGTVVKIGGFSVLKNGLPGQEAVPQFVIATGEDFVTGPLCLFLGTVEGSSTATVNDVIRTRTVGLFNSATFSSSASFGSPVYIGTTGELTIDLLSPSIPRIVGTVVGEVSPGRYSVYFDGFSSPSAGLELYKTTAGSIGEAPSNIARLINDNNAVKLSVNGSPYVDISSGALIPFDLGMYFLGKPETDDVILRYTFNQAVDFDSNFAGSHATADVVATGTDAEFTVFQVVGAVETSVASILYGPGDLTASLDTGGLPVSFAAGETIKIVSLSSNPTLSGLAINLRGIRG